MKIFCFNQPMRSGFFISCRLNKEAKGLKEVIGGLERLVESPSAKIANRKSFKQLLEEEIEEYRNTTRFVKYSGYKTVLFLENRSNESSLALFYKLRDSDIRFDYAHRVIPLEYFFRYDDKRILDSIKGLDETKTYKILYEERLCGPGVKAAIFELITGSLSLRVDLTKPYYTIVVQTFKSSVGISVVINERGNFNFSST